ncbi:hypothetical protein [Haloarchaeobius sp. DT45]|uniref:hypothetical protein n=1 Tax=Haloarchaeobius sp. DT45 TaxID=3446116 RepID=UPI003F6BB625
MASDAYRLGLLLVVFGGFLLTSGSGSFPDAIGLAAMLFGLAFGVGGLVQSRADGAE